MRVSKKFLNDYIKIDDFKEYADKMVLAGNEFDSYTKLCDASDLVVGKVIECVKHPNSEKLHICKVDYGEGIKQIVCGAPNVRENIKVIVAKIGSKVGNITIKKASLAGEESEGMLCSLAELGLESKYLTSEDKMGIHILDDDALIGTDAIKYLELDDEIVDFELTSNRGDLLSIIGMAYEASSIYGLDIKQREIKFNEKGNIDYKLDVKTDKCFKYLGKVVKNITIKESPLFIKNRLIASGIRPINNVVDISNYVMMEYGQPLHFFDALKLGNKVIVRNALNNEKLVTLDNIERTLTEDDIVICNDEKIVALAGVMGGLDTEITNETVNIFIESAIFSPYNVRLTSNRILRSEASNRFEKGIDPNVSEIALNRACELLELYATGEVVGGMVNYDTTIKNDKKIGITLNNINNILGQNLKSSDIEDILNRLQFKYVLKDNVFNISVPTRRMDINIKEDIIEEVGRLYGYDHVIGKLPLDNIKKGTISNKRRFTKNIRNRLIGCGLNQVLTYSLVSNNSFDNGYSDVVLTNPMSEDKKILRKSIIPSLVNVYEYNKSRNIENINIFEIGSIYYKSDNYVEETMVSGLMSGTYLLNKWQNINVKVDFYLVKGIIENILNYLGLSNRYSFEASNIPNMHPFRCANIFVDKINIGFFGQINPSYNKNEIYVFELNVEKLMKINVRNIKFKEISKYPSIVKDLAFVVDNDVNSSDIEKTIKKTGGKLLTNIEVFDVYKMNDQKSIAYSLTFSDNTRTLSDEEVLVIFNKIIVEVEKTGVKLRN